ncbi:hypothetical protein ACOSP7_014789 [Xanthoceras sorbifolium]
MQTSNFMHHIPRKNTRQFINISISILHIHLHLIKQKRFIQRKLRKIYKRTKIINPVVHPKQNITPITNSPSNTLRYQLSTKFDVFPDMGTNSSTMLNSFQKRKTIKVFTS